MQLCLRERSKKILMVKQRLKLLSVILQVFLVFLSFAFAKDTQSIKRDIELFNRGYQLMVKYASDSIKIKNVLDTLQVPDYVKKVLEFMAVYSRSVFEGKHVTCVSKAKQLLDKIEEEYSGNVPEHHYKWMIGAVNQGYGSCLYYLGDYISSFLAYKEAYEMFNSIGDSTFAAITLTNMATVLVKVKMYDEVLRYYVMAKKYLIKDTLRLVPLNINIGVIYMILERPDLALRQFNEALMLANIVLEKDSGRLSDVERKRLVYRRNIIKTNIASLFLNLVENREQGHNMELIKKLKMSIVQILDSARALNRQVDTSMTNFTLKGAFWDNEFRYWRAKSELEKTQETQDSLAKYLQALRKFYKKYGDYDREGKSSAFIATLEYKNIVDIDKEELYNECLEIIELEHQNLQSLSSSLVKIDLPAASSLEVDKILGELPYQCNMKYAVSVGLAILFGTLLVFVAFLYSRGKRRVRR